MKDKEDPKDDKFSKKLANTLENLLAEIDKNYMLIEQIAPQDAPYRHYVVGLIQPSGTRYFRGFRIALN